MTPRARAADPARPALRADEVVGLAVAVADAEGIAAVSMRRLARELTVTPMALYWHFDSRDALLDAMAERVVAAAEFSDDPTHDWETRYRHALAGLIALLQDHPWMGRTVIERVVPQPNYLAALEVLLDCTRAAGLDPATGVVVVEQAVQTIAVTVEYEPKPPAGPKADAIRADVADLVARVDPDDFPNVHRAADPLLVPPARNEYYSIILDTLAAGLRSVAASRAQGTDRSQR